MLIISTRGFRGAELNAHIGFALYVTKDETQYDLDPIIEDKQS